MPPLNVPTLINIAAIVVMVYCVILMQRLKKDVPGGVVGKRWGFLSALVTLFALGYLVTPFFGLIPAEMMNLIVSLIFFFGAIYVVISVRLVHAVIAELSA
jgi:hypothetical protein